MYDRSLATTVLLAIGAIVGVAAAHTHDAASAEGAIVAEHQYETPFLVQNAAAMNRMMETMHVEPTGNVDVDFVAMMIPHHQGAIDMALAQLRYGKNETLHRIAQEIIVEQQQEIVAMRLALGQTLPPPAPAPTQIAPSASQRASATGIALSSRDRVYVAEQFSNTVSVTDPFSNKLLGVIRLGDPQPGNLSPLYRGQVLVHGLGFSPDHRTIVVVSIASNSVVFVDTATNAVKHTTYVGRSPHEAFFTPDGKEVWVTVRGEDYVAVLSSTTYEETARIKVASGPGMQIFSPDGKYGYVCSSFTPETAVIRVADHQIVARVKQESPFCPNIAVTPDGKQVWFTLKDIGKVQVFNAQPPFDVLRIIDTGPITNHVNFAYNDRGKFAYVTVGGLNVVKVFATDTFAEVATIPVGKLPHGLWPSGDGSRVYVGLENADALAAIDTSSNSVIATIPMGLAPQAVIYVPNAVPEGNGTMNLRPLGADLTAHLTLVSAKSNSHSGEPPTSVTLFDQGLTQIVQASVTGLEPKKPYVLALARRPDGSGVIEPLSTFMTSPTGSAIVNAVGPIRQIVQNEVHSERRYLVIAEGAAAQPGAVVQRQAPN